LVALAGASLDTHFDCVLNLLLPFDFVAGRNARLHGTANGPYHPAMPRWNLHSYVADVLSLGPRTAGRLMQVGVRTVADLLAAKPRVVARRIDEGLFSIEVIELWQREAQLVLAAPRLPGEAARVLTAIGYHSAEKIARSTPTELLGAFEMATKQASVGGLLEKKSSPAISELMVWIRCAQSSAADLAA